MVFNGNTERKTEHTIWKSIKNWAENWCQIVCGILFDLICCMTSSVRGLCLIWKRQVGKIELMATPELYKACSPWRTSLARDGHGSSTSDYFLHLSGKWLELFRVSSGHQHSTFQVRKWRPIKPLDLKNFHRKPAYPHPPSRCVKM